MPKEVESSPNRCPSCQKVQMSPNTCVNCYAHSDFLDILEIIENIIACRSDLAKAQVLTMRQAIFKRG